MLEKDLQNQVYHSLQRIMDSGEKLHYFKIPDSLRGALSRFSPRKGYDCFVVKDGKFYALELKLAKQKSWAYDKLDEYQEAYLKEVQECGGNAFVLIGFLFKDKVDTVRGLFAIPINLFLEMRSESTRKSLTYDECKITPGVISLEFTKEKSDIVWSIEDILGQTDWWSGLQHLE